MCSSLQEAFCKGRTILYYLVGLLQTWVSSRGLGIDDLQDLFQLKEKRLKMKTALCKTSVAERLFNTKLQANNVLTQVLATSDSSLYKALSLKTDRRF